MNKYHRGDKFIIEIAEKHTFYYDNNKSYALYRVKGFKSLVFDDNGLDKLNQMEKHKQKISNFEFHKAQDSDNEIDTRSAKFLTLLKYQTSLTTLKDFVMGEGTFINDSTAEKALDNLQELVNKYSKIKQFDRALFFNAKHVVVNGISYEQLEKALDIACNKLSSDDWTKEQWKDQILSEAKK